MTTSYLQPAADEVLVFDPQPATAVATVEIVIPVYNEEADLEASVRRLHTYLGEQFPLSASITIADNASTDQTWPIACRLAHLLPRVRAVRLASKGRGRALRAVWSRSDSPVVAYMDVDLSTDLAALVPLVAPLVSGHSDLAIGSRLATASRVVRGAKREAISRSYNLILKATLQAGFSDAQCGFKAARTDAVKALLPLVQDQGWFFDTELLVLAEHNGLRIHEVPVDWVDDPGSTVHVASTARDDLLGVWRLVRTFARGGGFVERSLASDAGPLARSLDELAVRFASIGVVSTIAFGFLFAVLAGPIGLVAADVVALLVCALANTAANRRLTFALAGRSGRARHHARGLAVAMLPLALNLAALAVAGGLGITSVLGALAVLTAVNAAAGTARFVLLARWVFSARRPS